MSSNSITISTEMGDLNHQSVVATGANVPKSNENPSECEDEDEEEDVDFNPFLKESPSPEASSSLSSEIEGLDAAVDDCAGNTCAELANNSLSKPPDQHDYAIGDYEHGEEIVMQAIISSGGATKNGIQKASPAISKEKMSDLFSQPKSETFHEQEDGSSNSADVNDVMVGQSSNTTHSRMPIMCIDDEGAICMRTRARYSLASFTLDELETFLQETDDDDDLQNVDDEEEYRKFLAAVLQCGDGDHQTVQENENVDDEDEENDADFELEIEEALESDIDENARDETQEVEHDGVSRRPKTRQSRQKKASAEHNKRFLGQLNRPLRPLLPNAPIAPFPALDGRSLMPENAPRCLPSVSNDCYMNGFTLHQIGQLHYLIYEHVQLLIQVFSLCVLEPAKQHIASEVQGLILDILHKRNQVLASRREPYASFFSCPPFIHASVPNELPKILPAQCTVDSSLPYEAQKGCSSGKNMVPPSDILYPSEGRCEFLVNGQTGHFEDSEGSFWAPYISGPILSVIDVAPLHLVGSYMDDVSAVARDYQRRCVGITCDTRLDREPLFTVHGVQSVAEGSDQVLTETTPPASNIVPSSSISVQMPRKTMAAALVERAKKQSVAPVPKEIAKLAQRFLPLFNTNLFPHKPPPAPVANRVLFTDAEDELLAMGLMEYNTDWKAIQQRFLPSKSRHQIFVRQKNRSSSKAPENPIKAIRRMKNSPLTAEEKGRIEEGLRVFKLDWMSIWKFIVPYRDPSLLPRQWRVATGTQKSYKKDADKKAKRRLYEANRRKCKPAALASCNTSSEKEDHGADIAGGENNSGDDSIDKIDESYVHEAFLADWRPGTSSISSKLTVSDLGRKSLPTYLSEQAGSHVRRQMYTCGSGATQAQVGHEFSPALRSSKSQFCLRPYRVRRSNNARLVKLAPDLPPVNLPTSVRVMPQSAFRGYQAGSSTKVSGADPGTAGPVTENIVPKIPHASNSRAHHLIEAAQIRSIPLRENSGDWHIKDCRVLGEKCATKDNKESDLQMHPLLFKTPKDGHLPYYPLNCSSFRTFNMFSGAQPQLNLSLFHNPHQASPQVNFFDNSLKSKDVTSLSFGDDFHPLLQRNDDVNYNWVTACSATQVSTNSESSRGICVQLQKSAVSSNPITTCSKPCSPSGKTNELDLDIHLSSTSGSEKAVGSRDVTMQNIGSDQCNEFLPSASIVDKICHEFDSRATSVLSSDKLNSNSVNNISDQSLPDIVMEQEELSDSDEESAEHVEFECEEMADSEGEEESGSEQNVNKQNKDALDAAVEKAVTDAQLDAEQCEPTSIGNSEGNFCGLSEDPTNKLWLTEKRKDTMTNSLCLNLNSCAPDSPSAKSKRAMHKYARGATGKDQASSRSNRSSSKNTSQVTKHRTEQKHDVHVADQPNLVSHDVNPSRNPRKRACRTDSSARRAKKRGVASNSDVQLNVDSSNSVIPGESG